MGSAVFSIENATICWRRWLRSQLVFRCGGHVVSLVVDNNQAPSNAGSVLYTDLLTPVVVVLLLWLSRYERRR